MIIYGSWGYFSSKLSGGFIHCNFLEPSSKSLSLIGECVKDKNSFSDLLYYVRYWLSKTFKSTQISLIRL